MREELPEFAIRVVSDGIVPLVVVDGDLDIITAPKLKRCIDELIESTESDVVVDLADVGYIDSTSLAVLLAARERFSRQQRSFAVANPSRPVLRLFEIAGVCDLIAATTEPGADGLHVGVDAVGTIDDDVGLS